MKKLMKFLEAFDDMKESTFSLLVGAVLVCVAMFDDNAARAGVGFAMAFCLLMVSRVCRAIERNGRNK